MALPWQGFLQVASVGGVGGGAGALRVGAAANQTGNLLGKLNADLAILTPEKMVGRCDHPGGVKKKRFGVTSYAGGEMFVPVNLAVKNPEGNGQSYKATRGGTEGFGNVQGSAAGWDHHDARWTPAGDLSAAMEVAHREADMIASHAHSHNSESHYAYVDRTKQAMEERILMDAEDKQRDRLRHLLEQGFTEEEIEAKLRKEREKNLERSQHLPYSEAKLVEDIVAKRMPTRLNEDFANASTPPGAIPLTKDLSAIERVTGQGNPVARAKKAQQDRVRDQMARRVDKVEKAELKEAHIPLDQFAMLKQVLHSQAAAKRDVGYHKSAHELEHIQQQKRVDARDHEHTSAMMKALARYGSYTHVEAPHGDQPYVPGVAH